MGALRKHGSCGYTYPRPYAASLHISVCCTSRVHVPSSGSEIASRPGCRALRSRPGAAAVSRTIGARQCPRRESSITSPTSNQDVLDFTYLCGSYVVRVRPCVLYFVGRCSTPHTTHATYVVKPARHRRGERERERAKEPGGLDS